MSAANIDNQNTPRYVYKVNIEATHTDNLEKQSKPIIEKELGLFSSLSQANAFARQCVLFGRRSRDYVPTAEEIISGERHTSTLNQDKDIRYHGGQIEATRSKYDKDGLLHYTAWIGGDFNGPQRATSKPLRPKRVDAWVEPIQLTDLSKPLTSETLDNWYRFMPNWIPRPSSTQIKSSKRKIDEKEQKSSSESTNCGDLSSEAKRQRRNDAHKLLAQGSPVTFGPESTPSASAACNQEVKTAPHNDKSKDNNERDLEIIIERRLSEEKEKWEKAHLASMKPVLAKERLDWEKADSEVNPLQNEKLKGLIKRNVEYRLAQAVDKAKKELEDSFKIRLENEREQWMKEQRAIEQRKCEGFKAFIDKKVEERLEKEKEKWLQQESARLALAQITPSAVGEQHISTGVQGMTEQLQQHPRVDDVEYKREQVEVDTVMKRSSSHASLTPIFDCGPTSAAFHSIVHRPSTGRRTKNSIKQQLNAYYAQAPTRFLSRGTEVTEESDPSWHQTPDQFDQQTGGTAQVLSLQSEPEFSINHPPSIAILRDLHEKSTRSFVIALEAYEDQTQTFRLQQKNFSAQQQLFEREKAELWSEKEQLKQKQELVLKQIADVTNLDFQLKTDAENLKERQRMFSEEKNAFENEQLLSKKKDEELFLEFQATMTKHGPETLE